MFKLLFPFLLVSTSFLSAFSQGQPISPESHIPKTSSGFEYQWMRKSYSSQSISVNDYVFFNMTLSIGDSVLQATNKPSVLKIMEDNKNYGQLKELVDLISTLVVGDSIKFIMPLESFESLPPAFEGFDQPLIYSVGIVSVMNESEFETYSDSLEQAQEKERNINRVRLPEIEAIVRNFWSEYMNGQKDDEMISHDSGLRYLILDPGEKGNKPRNGEMVTVHYYGFLESNGEEFDSSFKNGMPIQFPLGKGQVIAGWDIGIPLFNIGSKGILFVPASLAYGEAGSPPVIPPNASIFFYVEIINQKQ